MFLIEGNPSGRVSCELSNWTGKAYKIPRIKVKQSIDREGIVKNIENCFIFEKIIFFQVLLMPLLSY